MALISKAGAANVTLDTLINVKGFDNAKAGTPYALFKDRAGLAYHPVSATAAVALDPAGGLVLNVSDQLQIKVDNTSGNPGLALSTDGVEVVDRVKNSGDIITGTLGMLAPITMNNNFIHELREPIDPKDAATKDYVDTGGVKVIAFPFDEYRFDSSLGLPSLPINGSWSVSGPVIIAYDAIIEQMVTTLDDDDTQIANVTMALTAQNWQDLFDFGGTLSWRGRIDHNNGENGVAIYITCDLADSPVLGETSDRRYILWAHAHTPDYTLHLVNDLAIDYDTNIPGTDRYTTVELRIPPGLGDGEVYINGVFGPPSVPYYATSISTSQIILSSGSAGGFDRVTYAEHFGLIIYKSPPIGQLTPPPSVGTRVIIPWGPRDYTIEASELITTVPIGITLDVWANNIGGKVLFDQEDGFNPRVTYDGRLEKSYEITEKTILKATQISSGAPRIVFMHDFGSYFQPSLSNINGHSKYVTSTITAEHVGVLNAGEYEWSMGAGAANGASRYSGYISALPTRIISGALSVASSTTGNPVPLVAVRISLGGSPTVFTIAKSAGDYVGTVKFTAPIEVDPKIAITLLTDVNDTTSIVTGHVTLQMISLA